MNFHFAPVQGHTDAAFRHFHAKNYNGDQLTYYTPFIRLEKGELRPKDLKDLTSSLNDNINLVPQIIFRDKLELQKLVEILYDLGYREIDLNMGCPFPLQTGHGRGAATITDTELAKSIVETVKRYPDVRFSVKMRLGMENPEEWKTLLPYLNSIPLKHLALHPRVARQQYGGEVNYEQFGDFIRACKNPVVYNGDLKSPADIRRIIERFPEISGIMIGRGLLSRPSLISEFIAGKEIPSSERIAGMFKFHHELYSHYSSVLCGDSQILSKIQPFWEYAEKEIGRKAWKAIRKAVNVAKYQTAIALITSK